jgi:hypothetical protein
VVDGAPLTLLGSAGAPPALAAPAWSVLLLGLAQLSLLGLLAAPLERGARRPRVVRAVRLALRAPMSLYLGFLTAMLLLIAVVYLPAKLAGGVAWLLRPGTVIALAMLACPAALVFWWFERLRWFEHRGSSPTRPISTPGRWGALLGRTATALGVGYATLGVFGFALTRFVGGNAEAGILGLQLDPIQSLIHLLLGMFLLHTVRSGTSATTSTWLVCWVACIPPLMAAADSDNTGPVRLLLHGATAACAVAASAGSLWQFRVVSRAAL